VSDISRHYLPALAEVSPEAARAARERLSEMLRVARPDLDTRPNSVFGDLWLNEAASLMAALDMAIARYKSDLDLENVANGIIWDCDFVAAFLSNFAVPSGGFLSRGVLRFNFSGSVPAAIPRGIVLTPATGGEFRPVLPHDGDISVGAVFTPDANRVRGVEEPDGSKWFLMNVEGDYRTVPVIAGVSFTASHALEGLVSIAAEADFTTGSPEPRLKDLAVIARDTAKAATMATKGGVRSFARQAFPFLGGCSPVCVGDADYTRDHGRGADIHIRSDRKLELDLTVRLTLDDTAQVFHGKPGFPLPPFLIRSVVAESAPDVNLLPVFHAKTADDTKVTGALAGYTPWQELYLTVPMPEDGGDPLVPTIVEGGLEKADFTIRFLADPEFLAMAAQLTAPENVPVAVDVLPRNFLTVFFNSLVVRYRRRPGTTVDTVRARAEILDYIARLSHPDVFSESRLADSLFYAGASAVTDVILSARLMYAPAENVLADDAPEPGTDFTAFLAASSALPNEDLESVAELLDRRFDTDIGVSASPVVARYILDPASLALEEVGA